MRAATNSCLGPIDPQLQLDDRLVPALCYPDQYENLIERSRSETLSTAELVLLQKLDLAEFHQFELARDRDLSIDMARRILKKNPNIDQTAIDRSRQAAKQLADVGVKVGGYRLEPAVGGKLVRSSGQSPSRKGQQGQGPERSWGVLDSGVAWSTEGAAESKV